MDSTYSVWTSLENQIKSIKTPAGRYSISEATGTITITDTKTAVDDIAQIIDHENGLLTRQIAMRVEVLSVKLTSGQQYGINWNVVFNKVTNMVPWALTFSSPQSLVATSAGSLGASVLTPTSGSPSAWSGSQAMFNALQEYGRVKVVTTANAMTVNRQPVPVAITQQTGYLAEITPAPAGASGNVGGTPGLTPGYGHHGLHVESASDHPRQQQHPAPVLDGHLVTRCADDAIVRIGEQPGKHPDADDFQVPTFFRKLRCGRATPSFSLATNASRGNTTSAR